MKNQIITLCFLFVLCPSQANQNDSVQIVLEEIKTLIRKKEYVEASTVLEKYKEMIIMGDDKSKIRLLTYHGDIIKVETPEEAITPYKKALKLCLSTREYVLYGHLSDRLGKIYRSIGNFPTAKMYFQYALDMRDSLNDKNGLAISYTNMGILHSNWSDRDSLAVHYFKQAYNFYVATDNKRKIAESGSNLGSEYVKHDRASEALHLLRSSLHLKNKLSFSEASIANTLHNLAWAFDKKNQIDSAIYYYRACVKIRESHLLHKDLASTYYNLGFLYLKVNQTGDAIKYLKKSEALVDQFNLLLLKLKVYYHLSQALFKDQQFEVSNLYFNRYDTLKYAIYNETSAKQFSELQVKYDTEKKKKEIVEQQLEIAKKNRIMITLLIIIALGLAAIYFYYQRLLIAKRLRAREKEIHEQEIKEMLQKQQMKTMAAMIKGQESERKRIATELHDRIGSMLSAVKLHFGAVDNDGIDEDQPGYRLLDETVEEVRKISHDLSTGVISQFGLIKALGDLSETLNSSKKITVQLHINNLKDRLDYDIEVALYRIFQELVANILKHANATEVSIQLTKNDNNLNVLVEDNGIGFEFSNAKFKGIGLQNVKERVQALSGTLDFDSGTSHGSTVNINIPI